MASGSGQELVPAEAAGVDLSVHKSGIVPTLQNIVATVNLDTKLDLKTIALSARNAEYNPKVWRSAVALLPHVAERIAVKNMGFSEKPAIIAVPWDECSALPPSSCAFGTPKPQRSSSPPARW